MRHLLARKKTELKPGAKRQTRTEPPSSIATAGMLAAGPISVIVFVALLLAGLSVLASLALTVVVQFVVLGSIAVIGLMGQSDADAAVRAAKGRIRGDQTPPEAWIFHARREGSDRQYRSALIAQRNGQTANIARVLSEIGSDVHQCADRDALLETVKARQDGWHLMLFDIETAQNIESAVLDLLDFRATCPEVPVILLSDSVARDDYSAHRRPIGDITLRKPVFRQRLIRAVREVGLELDEPFHDL